MACGFFIRRGIEGVVPREGRVVLSFIRHTRRVPPFEGSISVDQVPAWVSQDSAGSREGSCLGLSGPDYGRWSCLVSHPLRVCETYSRLEGLLVSLFLGFRDGARILIGSFVVVDTYFSL